MARERDNPLSMRSSALVVTLFALATGGCLFADEDVGDSVDGGPHADAMIGEGPDAGEADAGGGPLPCDQDLACPAPAAGKAQICGRILDLQTSADVEGPVAEALEVRFHDASALAGGAGQGLLLTVHPDACGRFTAGEGVAVPAIGYVGVAVDDVGLPPGEGPHVLTTIALPVTPNGKTTGVRAYSARETTDAAWSGTASPSLAAQGAFVAIFLDTNRPDVEPYHGTPAAGVRVELDGAIDDANDLYFDDVVPTQRGTIGTTSATGPNGTGIRTGTPLSTSYTGSGPTGCTWPEVPSFTLPGSIVVAEIPGACS
jgi:hypothetical protein